MAPAQGGQAGDDGTSSSSTEDSGRPLVGRSQGTIRVRRSSIALLQAHSASHLQFCKYEPRPVSHWSVANRIAPDIRRDQACRAALRAPWRRLPPQRNFGAKPCPRGRLHCAWLSPSGRRQSFGGSRPGRFSKLQSCRWHQGGVQITFSRFTPVRFPGSPPLGQTVTRSIDSHRTAAARAACGSRPAPACALAP